MQRWERRRMGRNAVALASLLLAAAILSGQKAEAQEKRPTAREVVAAIQEHVGIPWQKETVDTFKAGNPDTPVTWNRCDDDGDDGRAAARGGTRAEFRHYPRADVLQPPGRA